MQNYSVGIQNSILFINGKQKAAQYITFKNNWRCNSEECLLESWVFLSVSGDRLTFGLSLV